jgi:uncharacterized membrane protein YfcA
MSLDVCQLALGAFSGLLVGCSLGLFGGGGSLLAVPLLVHLVGLSNPHQAIGTSAVAVAANALAGIASHARRGTIRWKCVAIYGGAGVLAAAAGSNLGKALDGQHLLMMFAALMFIVGILMLRQRQVAGSVAANCTLANAPKVVGFGLGTGFCSGFFGIGGGFLIVPGLVASTGMPMVNAIGSSLVIISAFGLTTTASYFISGFVIWPLAFAFVAGGVFGAGFGCRAAHMLSSHNRVLNVLFACVIMVAAVVLLATGWQKNSARADPPRTTASETTENAVGPPV